MAVAIRASSLSSSSSSGSMFSGSQTSPCSMQSIAVSIVRIGDDFGMKPLAPCCIARRMITGSSTAETITVGNHRTVTCDKGDHTTKIKLGKTYHEAMKSIEFKCGASSIKMDPKSITIKAPMITIKGEATCDIKSPMTTVKGDAMLTLKGGITMIN